MATSRQSLTLKEVEALSSLVSEIQNNQGVLSAEFVKKLYDDHLVSYSDHDSFMKFIMDKIVPKLSDKELFNLTRSLMIGHLDHDHNNPMLRAQGLLDGKLYTAFATRLGYIQDYRDTDRPQPEAMTQLHKIIYEWHLRYNNDANMPKGKNSPERAAAAKNIAATVISQKLSAAQTEIEIQRRMNEEGAKNLDELMIKRASLPSLNAEQVNKIMDAAIDINLAEAPNLKFRAGEQDNINLNQIQGDLANEKSRITKAHEQQFDQFHKMAALLHKKEMSGMSLNKNKKAAKVAFLSDLMAALQRDRDKDLPAKEIVSNLINTDPHKNNINIILEGKRVRALLVQIVGDEANLVAILPKIPAKKSSAAAAPPPPGAKTQLQAPKAATTAPHPEKQAAANAGANSVLNERTKKQTPPSPTPEFTQAGLYTALLNISPSVALKSQSHQFLIDLMGVVNKTPMSANAETYNNRIKEFCRQHTEMFKDSAFISKINEVLRNHKLAEIKPEVNIEEFSKELLKEIESRRTLIKQWKSKSKEINMDKQNKQTQREMDNEIGIIHAEALNAYQSKNLDDLTRIRRDLDQFDKKYKEHFPKERDLIDILVGRLNEMRSDYLSLGRKSNLVKIDKLINEVRSKATYGEALHAVQNAFIAERDHYLNHGFFSNGQDPQRFIDRINKDQSDFHYPRMLALIIEREQARESVYGRHTGPSNGTDQIKLGDYKLYAKYIDSLLVSSTDKQDFIAFKNQLREGLKTGPELNLARPLAISEMDKYNLYTGKPQYNVDIAKRLWPDLTQKYGFSDNTILELMRTPRNAIDKLIGKIADERIRIIQTSNQIARGFGDTTISRDEAVKQVSAIINELEAIKNQMDAVRALCKPRAMQEPAHKTRKSPS